MNRVEEEDFNPKGKTKGEVAHTTGRALIGLLPAASGTVLELFNFLIEDPFSARRTAWLQALTNALNEAVLDIDRLREDTKKMNTVLSVLLQSTDVALKTADSGMHRSLIQIVLQALNDATPDEELLTVYLSTLRQLTSSHLRLLDLIAVRKRYEQGAELQRYEAEFLAEISQAGIGTIVPSTRLLSDLSSLHLIYSPAGSPWTSNLPNYCTMTLTEFGVGLRKYLGGA
jgi:hypothetical protein